jgi:hypothetical protein
MATTAVQSRRSSLGALVTAVLAIAGRRRPVARWLIGAATALVAGAVTVATIQFLSGPGPPGGELVEQSPVARSTPGPASTPTMTASCSETPSSTVSPTDGGTLDPTGILLVAVGEQVQALAACDEERNLAFDSLLRLAMAHDTDFGYPWIDPTTKELVFSVVTAEGRSRAEDAAATIAFPSRIREATHSYAELQQIQDDVTYLREQGVVDAELIYMVVPDQRDNRTMIVISEMSRPLLEELGRRFGADAIAVQIDPNRPNSGY